LGHGQGFTSGVSSTAFGAGTQLNREQAATMLSAVYRKLGGTIPPQEAAPFSDRGSISAWAMDSVCFAASKGVISGYEDGRFGPKDSAQRQACLIMALRMQQKLGSSAAI
ncbi:MAG: S-layer homology domain-containing protein, partial [Flavonifractor plautii]